METNLEDLKPNKVGTVNDPVNIGIMDVSKFIHTRNSLPVTSSFMFEQSSNEYHNDGLYSELIFGTVGSPDRMLKFGYIELNTLIFNPKIFKILYKLKSIYKDIMSGQAYATFNPIKKDFERIIGDPLDNPDANTGFSFFLNNFSKINFRSTDSDRRDDKIAVLKMYQDNLLMTRYLVEPAGLRDISNDSSGRLIQDDINKLYISLLLYSRSIPKGSTSILYDSVRYQVQSKAQEIYEYIENFLDGKRGFIQGNFSRRKIAGGTRNVITAAPFMNTSPEDPKLLKADDVIIGIYQTIKGLQPFAKYAFNTMFVNPIFKEDATTSIALSDPVTGELVYTTISPTTRDTWTSSDGIDDLINRFRNTDLRSKPVYIKDTDGKDFALCMIYDDIDEIAMCRSVDDLEAYWPRPINKKKLRPITYVEMFYLIAETISAGKHAMVTRYPILGQGSSYVSNIHVTSTATNRTVNMLDLLSADLTPIVLKHYPVIGSSYMDAAMVHPSKLGGLGGDFDGDKISIELIYGNDSNEECAKYLDSTRSIMDTNLRFITGSTVYLQEAVLHNLTYK